MNIDKDFEGLKKDFQYVWIEFKLDSLDRPRRYRDVRTNKYLVISVLR